MKTGRCVSKDYKDNTWEIIVLIFVTVAKASVSIELGILAFCKKVLESCKEVLANTTSPYNILINITH